MSNTDELSALIAELIEQGYSPKEAVQIATKALGGEGGGGRKIQRRSDSAEERLTRSPQNDSRRAVDYGDETPQEAYERWLEQERNDPQGIYSMGGATLGGVFGGGTIATELHDPDANNRNLSAMERIQGLRIQAETLNTLRQLQQSVAGTQPPPRRLANPFQKFLGKKKR